MVAARIHILVVSATFNHGNQTPMSHEVSKMNISVRSCKSNEAQPLRLQEIELTKNHTGDIKHSSEAMPNPGSHILMLGIDTVWDTTR